MGTVKHKEIKEYEVKTIYLELDNKCAGQIRMSGSDVIAKNKWVSVKRVETSIYLSKCKSTSPAIKRTQFTVHNAQLHMYSSQCAGFEFNFVSC